MTLTHDKSSLGCTTLAGNVLNINQGPPTWCTRESGRPYGLCGLPVACSDNNEFLYNDEYLLFLLLTITSYEDKLCKFLFQKFVYQTQTGRPSHESVSKKQL